MKAKYRLFERASGVFYIEDTETKRQESLKTKDKEVAHRLWHAKNEANEQPAINLQIARVYLAATDAAASSDCETRAASGAQRKGAPPIFAGEGRRLTRPNRSRACK